MNSQQKETMVGELVGAFQAAELAVLINYQGSTCEELTSLRKKLKPMGARFAVVKNSLARRALKGTPGESLGDLFAGPTAVVWSETDPVSPAKLLKEFAKDNEKFHIKAGILGDRILDAAQIDSLATMPSHEQLLANLLALMNAPATRLVQTMAAPATQLVRVLEAWRAELEKKGN